MERSVGNELERKGRVALAKKQKAPRKTPEAFPSRGVHPPSRHYSITSLPLWRGARLSNAHSSRGMQPPPDYVLPMLALLRCVASPASPPAPRWRWPASPVSHRSCISTHCDRKSSSRQKPCRLSPNQPAPCTWTEDCLTKGSGLRAARGAKWQLTTMGS